ncbi:MAG: hypothetical protein ACPGSO_01705 [Vicingaceae bacterium]
MKFFDYYYYKVHWFFAERMFGESNPAGSSASVLSVFYGLNFLPLNTFIISYFNIEWGHEKIYQSLALNDLPAVGLGLIILGLNHYRYSKVKKIDEIKSDFEKEPPSKLLKMGTLIFGLLIAINLIVYLIH